MRRCGRLHEVPVSSCHCHPQYSARQASCIALVATLPVQCLMSVLQKMVATLPVLCPTILIHSGGKGPVPPEQYPRLALSAPYYLLSGFSASTAAGVVGGAFCAGRAGARGVRPPLPCAAFHRSCRHAPTAPVLHGRIQGASSSRAKDDGRCAVCRLVQRPTWLPPRSSCILCVPVSDCALEICIAHVGVLDTHPLSDEPLVTKLCNDKFFLASRTQGADNVHHPATHWCLVCVRACIP